MAVRCVYTDLDGTLLGQGASLFTDYEGNFSLSQSRGLQACARAGVEVVIMSGRRRVQVHEDARLIGQGSYIFEAGSGLVVDGEMTLLLGDFDADSESTVVEQVSARGVPDLLFERYDGRLEFHEPWHLDRETSHLFRGEVDTDEANAFLVEHGHGDLRLLDNGAIGRPMPGIETTHAYHLVPKAVSKAAAVDAHARIRGYSTTETIAVGDSREDLDVARVVGQFFVVANGPEKDPGLRQAITGHENVTVTEGSAGDGFYEAVVSSLVSG